MAHNLRARRRALLVAGAAALAALTSSATAVADPVGSGTARAFGITAELGGTEVIAPTPSKETVAPPFADNDETVASVPAEPLAVSGTLIAMTAVHEASDLPSVLEQAPQSVAGPYNARAVGEAQSLQVLMDEGIPGGQLIDADFVTGEAVAVCSGGSVQYSASSEVVNLQIGGEDPLSGPLNDLVDEISAGLNDSGLAELVDVDVNVVTPSATGTSVDALVVTLLAAAGDPPLGQIRIGHAEVSGVACGGAAAADPPACSDTQDNDGDGVIDAQDPGCHTDGDASNVASYDPNDDDEANPAPLARPAETLAQDTLPATGAAAATGGAALLAAVGAGLHLLRRRAAA
jgi:hypothetical protein